MLKVQDSELHVDGYDLCTNVNRCKRGVLIYTATHLKATPCDFSCDFDENVWVGVKLQNKDNLLIGSAPDLGLGRLGSCPGASTKKGLHKSTYFFNMAESYSVWPMS